MEAAHPAHIPWDHPSIQPGTAKPEFKEPEAGEPAYLHYLHPAPSAAVEAAAPHAVVATGRTIEEPFFIARAAAAAPARAAAPAPREETTAPPEVPTIGPEAPTWPEPAAHAPEPPDHPDVPDYILKAPAPVVPELPFRLRPAWEPEPPKVEPARHEPPVVDQQRYEFLQTEHVQPEPVKFEPVLPKPVKPEPVLPQAVAAAPVPMPESRPDSLPDPLMETPQPSAARTPLAEIRSTVAPFVAYPMRGREPVRPFAVEFRPAAPPPAEAAPVPEPEFRSAPEAAPAPRRDYSVSVMPPLPAARKREPLPRPDSDPRAGTHQDPQVLFDAPQTDAHPVEETRPAAAAHPVEETRPAAARLVVDKIPVEEQTHFPFPQRPPEPRVAPAPELPARAYEPARPDPSQVEELMSSSVGPEVDAENLPYSAASRLGGLRNLMVSLGLKNLQREAEFRSAGIESDSERIPERAVYAQPANAPEGAPEPESVVARPEIIPPRIGPEAAERAKGPIRSVKSPRVKSWESTDDVETLPSRRGQYRRR
jgi:hypothetical protein